MKRINTISIAIAMFSILLIAVSCKKDSSTSSSSNSQNTVEQNKTDLNNAGVNFVKQLDQMNQNKGFDALAEMSRVMGKDNLIGNKKKSLKTKAIGLTPILVQVQSIVKYHQHQMSMKDLFSSMNLLEKNAKGNKSMKSKFDSLKGIYNWDTLAQQWVKQGPSDNLVLNFPGSKTSLTDNATFTVSDFDTQEVNSSEIPISLKWDLSVDGTSYISFAYSSTFTNNIPSAVSATLTISPWVFSLSATLSTTYGSFKYSFKNGTQVLFEFDANADGDWSQQNTDTNPTPDKIIYDGGVTFILMDIKMVGNLDFKDLYPYTNNNDTTLAQEQDLATAINKYLSMKVEHSIDNSLIASSDAYVTSETDSKWIYNYTTGQWEQQSYTAYNIDMRFKFPDGTTADMQTYTKEGFKEFVDELNLFLQDISTKFGFDYKPINYGSKK